MGFSANAAKRALIKNKDNLEGATNWIMENMGDQSINAPLEEQSKGSKGPDPASINALLDFGFDETQAKVALLKNVKVFLFRETVCKLLQNGCSQLMET